MASKIKVTNRTKVRKHKDGKARPVKKRKR